jgi:hypothetical protein
MLLHKLYWSDNVQYTCKLNRGLYTVLQDLAQSEGVLSEEIMSERGSCKMFKHRSLKTSVFQPFFGSWHPLGLKKFGGTLLWQKMPICSSPSSKTLIRQ